MTQKTRSWKRILSVLTSAACFGGNGASASSASPTTPFTEGTIPFPYHGETFHTYYKVFGDIQNRAHTPLVVLHGGPGLTHDYMIPISDLAHTANIPVVFYDQLGNGRSTHLREKPADFWSVELFMDELSNLLNHFSIQDSFHLLGHSWGGELGTEFEVQRKPKGLKKLVISDTPASSALWGQSLAQLMQTMPQDVQDGLMVGLADPQKYWAALQVFSAVYGCTLKHLPAAYNASFLAIFGPHGDTTVASAPFSNDWTIVDRIPQITVPTLLLNGHRDMAQDFVMEPFFKGIPDVKWTTFMNSTHTPFWEERARYMEVVGDYLKKTD